MKEFNLKNDILNAAKWSSITEILVKLVSPVINMILARILAPQAFGVVATTTMIVSFADMFTDAGFQKYLVQRDFKDEKTKYQNADVAFWTNLTISFILCLSIFLFKEQLASLVGNPGLGNVVAISSLQLLLTAFSSIQMALYRRDFDFKTLFVVRLISAFIPVIVTLPLAFIGLGYWSIIIGNLLVQLTNAFILTLKSKWKPGLFYSFSILKEMFSFSMWSLIEAISIWLTTWIDTFIIGNFLSQYYLGLYKTSTSMVNSLLVIITGATTPVLFSSLSRLQDREEVFNKVFLTFQRIISLIVFPLGIGVYLYSDLATDLLLGSQWNEASKVVGIWALTSSVMIVYGNYCSEIYRAKGQPKLSFIAQILHLIVLIPACIISARYGFWALVYTRSLIRLQFIVVHFFIMKYAIKFPLKSILLNTFPTALSAVGMGVIGFYIKDISNQLIWEILSIGICMAVYIVLLMMFPSIRRDIKEFSRKYF